MIVFKDWPLRRPFAASGALAQRATFFSADRANTAIEYMIKSFTDKDTERIFQSNFIKKFSKEIRIVARRKLWSIDIAMKTSDLNVPPGNRLEQLEGNRKGQHSIRINDQWRICFVWNEMECITTEVEIVDYH